MAEQASRHRFAIAVFYDTELLLGALSGFLGLGLGLDDLWLAGKPEMLQNGSALQSGLEREHCGLAVLLEEVAVIGELPSKAPLCCTLGAALETLQDTNWKSGVSCLESFLKGDIGPILLDHADKGAVIIIARTGTPVLQDQCMRVLLRHSLHVVYSRECRQESI
jgi:hypothetical protein